jgi:putative CocE/NonD family hydrolase
VWDGTRLYLEVWRPKAEGRFPVIFEYSPYNTGLERHGDLPLSEGGLSAYFAPRGYAVALADVRGTGNSEGCQNYLGATDKHDAFDLVEWLAARDWSSGRVGMVGASYVGSTPIIAAASGAPHLVTIVPVAGLAQMYDHQFQAGVPYFLQWAGAAGTYDTNSPVPSDTDDPGFARNAASAGCGIPHSAAMNGPDLVTGRFNEWHADRDWRVAAARADIPIFLVQGFSDHSVRPVAMKWFVRRRGVQPGDKLWLGQWAHEFSNRGTQWIGVLHRWFDRHLQMRDVDTGPQVEVFLNDRQYVSPQRGPVRTGMTWPGRLSEMTLYPSAGGGLLEARPRATLDVPFAANPRTEGALFQTPRFPRATEIAGFPRVTLNVTLTCERVDVIAVLSDVSPTGLKTYITQAAMNPELRNGLGVVTPVVPGERMRLRAPAQPHDFLVRKGHRLVLDITSHNSDKVPLFPGPCGVIVHTGGQDPTRFSIGVVDEGVYFKDPRPIED